MRFPLIGVALMLMATPAAGAAAPPSLGGDEGRAAASRVCPPGTTPIIGKRDGKPILKRDKRGRLRCKLPSRSALPAPAASPTAQIGQVADVLETVADINPKAFKKLEKAIGARRTARLLKVGLTAWREAAGAARQSAPETKTFSSGGAEGKATFGLDKVEGADSGFKATASAEMKVSRADLEKFSPTLKDELPADVTGATAKVAVSFEDVAATCPNDKGAVPGRLRGKGSITVAVERSDGPPIEMTLSADVDTTYTAQIGADGKVNAINGVDVKTTFQTGGSGKSTQTYRGRIQGSGFGREGILDAPSGKSGAAIERDAGHFDPDSGGVFGPHGSWRYGKGFPISDLRTVDNIKAMAATSIATQLLTLAAVEYLRKVTLDRIEKSACGYYVLFDIESRAVTAGYNAFGKLYLSAKLRSVAGSATRWTGSAEAPFANVTFTPKDECAMHTIVNEVGTFQIDIELLPSGNIKVTWSGNPSSSASVDCPPDDSDPPYDPPPVAGMQGPSLLGVSPTTFELPAAGGVQTIGGGIDAGDGDGIFDSGTLLVSRDK
jgi:hypothetical protein